MKPSLLLPLLGMLACSSAGSTSQPGMDAGLDSGSDAAIDAGDDAGIDAGIDSGVDAGRTERQIFVTATRQNAKFGGIAGADALCASQASTAGLEGEFKAWLSTINSPVSERLTRSQAPYVLVDGTLVANNWDDLVDDSILAPINLDADGIARGGDVWTGTLPNGLAYDEVDCEGFTSSSVLSSGLCGSSASIGTQWTASAVPDCSTALLLYCIEQ